MSFRLYGLLLKGEFSLYKYYVDLIKEEEEFPAEEVILFGL